jgi:hypothetical protein
MEGCAAGLKDAGVRVVRARVFIFAISIWD